MTASPRSSTGAAAAGGVERVGAESQRTFHVAFFIGGMTAGGAERVTAIMANHWVARGWRVTLLTSDDGITPSFYELDPRIQLVPMGFPPNPSATMTTTIRNTPVYLRTLRARLQELRPDVVISFVYRNYVVALLATRGLNIPVIASNRNNAEHISISTPWKILQRLTYPLASRIVEQTDQSAASLPPRVRHRARVIPNPVVAPSIPRERKRAGASPQRYRIVAMGRLVHQKGFDLLLRAFATVAPDHPDWRLVIWGEGRERARLEALRREWALDARVELPGLTTRPWEQFQQADLFVLSSRYEGFPNALTEAMASGAAVISFDCPFGPGTIIRHGVDGLLVRSGDVEALARSLRRLMRDPSERERLASRAPDVLQRFGIDQVMRQWDQVIDELCCRSDDPSPP
jgi:glycosyltransferase involved in cell wall biosynthesis